MRDLPAIRATYVQINDSLDAQRLIAVERGNAALASQIEKRQVINDQAYFILCWGQLEAAIDDKCREAIRNRISNPDWTKRRGWDIYNPDDKRLSGLSFDERAALVVDKSAGPKSPWAKIMKHYELRNKIAHGTLQSTPIDVPIVIQDLFDVQSNLRT